MTRNTPVPWLPAPIARVGESVYRAELARRSRRFDAGCGVVTIDRPVISVGNLSVGGTGKTPMVSLIVRWLLDAGLRPVIAMRGYAARAGLSDEAAEYGARFGDDAPVVAQPDRLEGLLRLFAGEAGRGVNVVVLDDGFQHRRIARAFDLVLIDASRDPFLDRCLPAGWLREPVEALSRASAVVLTHTELTSRGNLDLLGKRVASRTGRGPIAEAEHAWKGLLDAGGVERPVTWLRGKRVAVVCAIGHPDAFTRAVERATGVPPAHELVLRDHDPYRPTIIDRIVTMASGCDAIVTTEKDWVKLARAPGNRWPCPVIRPTLELRLARGGEALRDRVLEAAATAPA
ncbi:MAG: tetraacyldisaccharide 4'-kinase [Phycisphaeraceae bacterium]|nr:MAG: tetraacyldisaccharide 4'-kinase [Phycisphaeraceae bacterium]